jgi:hypothetical protein
MFKMVKKGLRAPLVVLNMWPYKLKLDEEKSKHVGLAKQTQFDWTFLHNLLRLVKGASKPYTC